MLGYEKGAKSKPTAESTSTPFVSFPEPLNFVCGILIFIKNIKYLGLRGGHSLFSLIGSCISSELTNLLKMSQIMGRQGWNLNQVFYSRSVLVSFPVAGIKYSDKTTQGRKDLSGLRVQEKSIVMGEGRWQEIQAAHHAASTMRRQCSLPHACPEAHLSGDAKLCPVHKPTIIDITVPGDCVILITHLRSDLPFHYEISKTYILVAGFEVIIWTEEMVNQLRALFTLTEDLGSIPREINTMFWPPRTHI